ncbi:hypothetical protein RO3G_09516 [Rhizopus delemar RA 99-880]|uniref:Defect at low temperature protein 1 n=1 Tax=Rhizopus delemar (strain RA 99-880 / ATCC MYA-4621 / FGSC 9543 / NRRL 43880) TaxID=246409 RepID=I1C8M6_RHIO9|nr:hypothetical protein RO3G_09516 [Rhizopus delemar RA 99-880]|eukprot:EIE84806.1 hypothetical protein RO3G_09516 [Rhizopus delemar RA 99-880]
MKSTRLPHYLYTASLFLLILLTAVCIAISAADVSIQALADKTTTGKFDFRNLVVVGGSYALLKVYLKIKHEFEQDGQNQVIIIIIIITAIHTAHISSGTPLFEGLDFKQAIARTPAIVENVAINIDPSYKRPLYCPVRQYIEFLIREGLVDKQLGTTYVEGYEIARFSRDPLSQQQYIDIMKHLAAILQNMGYNIKANQQTNAETESMMSSSHRTGSSSNRSFRLYNLVSRTNRPHSAADDAISVTQSLNTWASQPQHRLMGDNEDDDDYSAYDEDEVRHDIYELLTRDRMHS